MRTVDDDDDDGHRPGPWIRSTIALTMDKLFIHCHEIGKGLLGQEAMAM